MRRVRVAWKVLRGRSVMYRCVVVIDPYTRRLYVAGRGGQMTIADNVMAPALVGSGEVGCFDWDAQMVYPLQLDGQLPR